MVAEVVEVVGPHTLAAGDFNADGAVDLALADLYGNSLGILVSDGLGDFSATPEISAGERPRSVAVADFNGDGRGGGFPAERGARSLAEFQQQQERTAAAMAQLKTIQKLRKQAKR